MAIEFFFGFLSEVDYFYGVFLSLSFSFSLSLLFIFSSDPPVAVAGRFSLFLADEDFSDLSIFSAGGSYMVF